MALNEGMNYNRWYDSIACVALGEERTHCDVAAW